MKIVVTDEAATWYKEELALNLPSQVKFFPRYGGVGGNIPGFSIGINNDAPGEIYVSVQVKDILFYIETNDIWYFENKDFKVELDHEKNEPVFTYI